LNQFPWIIPYLKDLTVICLMGVSYHRIYAIADDVAEYYGLLDNGIYRPDSGFQDSVTMETIAEQQ